MITKGTKLVKKCCLYASDFHLEMILLPYIKERIDKSKFLIITQNDLSDTIKILLDRVNIDKKQKEEILKLNWKESPKQGVKSILQLFEKNDEISVIVNGESNYVEFVNENINSLTKSIEVINCFSINDMNLSNIKNSYDEVLNTSKL